jgi:hypothetical protein
MKLASSTRPPQVISSHVAAHLEVSAEASQGLLTEGQDDLEDWWPCQAFCSLEVEPHAADSLWRPFGRLIGS